MKRRICLIAALLLAIGTTAFAKPKVENRDGILQVSGTEDITKPRTGQITIRVLKPGITTETFAASPDIEDCFFVGEQTIGADGSYSFSIPMNDETPYGEYVILVGKDEQTYLHASQADIKLRTAVECIRDAENHGTVKDVIKECKEILGITKSYTDSEWLKIAKALYQTRKTITVSNYQTVIAEAEKAAKKNESSTGGGGGGGGGSYAMANIGYKPEETTSQTTVQPLFSDVPLSHWAYPYITDLAGKNIVSGRGDGSFAPSDEIKREEFAKMLADAFLETNQKASDGTFRDVPAGAWYEGYVYALYQNGALSGLEGNLFGTGYLITRQDAVVLVYRCLRLGGTVLEQDSAGLHDFETVSDYAKEAVSSLCKAGIVNGNEAGLFQPQKSLTRAEAAKILSDAIKIRKGKV